MSFFVGAYASSPCSQGWDQQREQIFYNELKRLEHVRGLEHPFLGQHLHAEDDDWFLANIDPKWEFVLTCMPGTMNALGQNPEFGIASIDEDGRKQAIAFLGKARDAVSKLNAHAGRPVVTAVAIQTAPNQERAGASQSALEKSLAEIVTWDWQGARLVIEHCDTPRPEQKAAKGFLSIEQEIDAVVRTNAENSCNLGVVINWGRSVIEQRSVDGAIEHIGLAKQAGILAGLMFSGVSDIETPYGLWADSHMPAAPDESVEIGAEGSLMTKAQIQRCLTAAEVNTLDVVGIKLGIRPLDETIDRRIAYNRSALSMMI